MVAIVSLTQECENITEQHKTGTRYISYILIKKSLKYISKGPINNMPALVGRSGDKPLSEPMIDGLL